MKQKQFHRHRSYGQPEERDVLGFVTAVSQVSQYFRYFEAQTHTHTHTRTRTHTHTHTHTHNPPKPPNTCGSCFGRQSVCSVIVLHFGMSKAVHALQFPKVVGPLTHASAGFQLYYSRFLTSLFSLWRWGPVWADCSLWNSSSMDDCVHLLYEWWSHLAWQWNPTLTGLWWQPSVYTITSCGFRFSWMRNLISDSVLPAGHSRQCFAKWCVSITTSLDQSVYGIKWESQQQRVICQTDIRGHEAPHHHHTGFLSCITLVYAYKVSCIKTGHEIPNPTWGKRGRVT